MYFRRRSIRLDGYNYSKCCYYFVTIDVQDKLRLFWQGNNVNEAGMMVENCWLGLKNRFGIKLDEFVVMPDHFHGIVMIPGNRAPIKGARTLNPEYVGAGFMPAQNMARTLNPEYVGAGFMPALDGNQNGHNLGEIIGSFKSISTGKYISGVKENNWPKFHHRLWQRNYYERVIRNEFELNRIRKYIQDNPKKIC